MQIRTTAATALTTLALIIGPAGAALAADDHTVRSGDTLSQIAAAHDVPGGWTALYEANRKVVGGNPHLIYPGQVLTLAGADRKPRSTGPVAAAGATHRPGTGHVTSRYGMRTHPITGVYKLHSGTDYSVGDGAAYAARAGNVTSASWAKGYGRMVTIDHGAGVVTRYAHLAAFHVSVGDRVTAGQSVGQIGSSGYSTGAHLHFEVLVDGEFINPASWLD